MRESLLQKKVSLVGVLVFFLLLSVVVYLLIYNQVDKLCDFFGQKDKISQPDQTGGGQENTAADQASQEQGGANLRRLRELKQQLQRD